MKTVKKFLSLLLAVAMLSLSATPVFAGLYLSNTTQINNANGSTRYAKATNAEYHTLKDYSMHYYSDGTWFEAYTPLTTAATAGAQYQITFSAKVVSGQLWCRTGWGDSAWAACDPTNGEWVTVTKTITIGDSDETQIIFHTAAAGEFYVDDVTLVPVGGNVNLVKDGDFDDVDESGSEPVFTSTTSQTSSAGAYYIEPNLDSEDAGEGYSLHFYAEGDGTGLEFVQAYTHELAAGTYTLTWYAKGTGTMFFYSGWSEFAAGEVNSDEWTKFTKTLTIDGDGDTYFLFTHDSKTAIDCYFDHISLVDANGVDYIKDGGFDEISADGTPVETVPEATPTPTPTPTPEPTPEPTPTPTPEPEKPALKDFTGTLTLSSTTKVEGTNTDTHYAKVTCDEFYGNSGYSLHLYTTGDWLEFSQPYTVSNLPAGNYTITWYQKGEGKVWFYSNWGATANPGEFAATHANDIVEDAGNGWTKCSRTIYIDGKGDEKFLFHNEGAIDLYIDSISLVGANGVNYIKDGTFDEVTVDGLETHTLSDTTIVNGTADGFSVELTSSEKNSGNFGVHMITPGGDGLTVTKTLTTAATAGAQYKLTYYAKVVSGQLWCRVGWGDYAWAAADSKTWIKVEKTITIGDSDTTTLFFFGNGATEAYIDDISLVPVNGGNNIVIDGGFENATEIKPVSNLRAFQAGTGTVTISWTNAVWDGIRGIRLYANERFVSGDFKLGSGIVNEFTLTGLEEGKRVPVMIEVYVAGEIFTAYIDVTSYSAGAQTEFKIGDWIANRSTHADVINFSIDSNVKAEGESSMRLDINFPGWEEGFAPYVKQQIKGVSSDTTYKLKFKSKAQDMKVFYVIEGSNWDQTFVIREGHDGVDEKTYDWKETTIRFTPAQDATSTEIYFYVESGNGSLWIDDVTLTVDGDTTNLVKNGGFEYVDYSVADPEFFDENGNALTAIQPGRIEVRTEITNYAMGDSFYPVVIVALYDRMELKAMTYGQMQVVQSILNLGNEFCVAIDVPEAIGDSDYKIKVMHWDGFDTIKPLGDTGILE